MPTFRFRFLLSLLAFVGLALGSCQKDDGPQPTAATNAQQLTTGSWRLDQIRKNNAIDNLAILCPNCHKMHDIGLIPTDVIRLLRDANAEEDWKLRIKDAGAKAAKTKKILAMKEKKSEVAKRAWISRNSKAKQKENS